MIRLFKRYLWLVVLIAMLSLFPQALTSQARLNNRVLVTGLAIDKSPDGYEVTAQVVLPTPGSEAGGEGATLDFVTETGNSLLEGISKISYKIGEIAGLSHANFIILGENMLDDDATTDLDYFIRDTHLPNSIMLLYSKGSAKEQIRKTNDLELSVGIGLQKVYLDKQASLSSRMVAMQEFIDFAYEPAGVSILPELKITKDDEAESQNTQSGGSGSSGGSSGSGGVSGGTSGSGSSGSGSSGSGSSGSGSSGSGSSGSGSGSSGGSGSPGGASNGGGGNLKNGRIEYYTPLAYFKDGAYKGTITEQEQIIAYLLTQPHVKQFDFVATNVDDDEIYNDAQVGLRILKKTATIKTNFSGDNPKLKIEIVLDRIQLLEVNNSIIDVLGAYPSVKPYINKTLKNAIAKQIKTNIEALFESTKAQNVDIFRTADFAYKFNKTAWQKYLKTCGDIDNYILDFEIDVDVIVKTFI